VIWLGVSKKDDSQATFIPVGFRQHVCDIFFQGYAFGVFGGNGFLLEPFLFKLKQFEQERL